MVMNKSLQASTPFSLRFKTPGKVMHISSYTGQPGNWIGEDVWLSPGQGTLLTVHRTTSESDLERPAEVLAERGESVLNDDDIAQHVPRVLDAFGVGKPLSVRALGGTATRKYEVAVSQGRFVVRMRPAEFAAERMIRFDHESLRRLADSGLPVRGPRSSSMAPVGFA